MENHPSTDSTDPIELALLDDHLHVPSNSRFSDHGRQVKPLKGQASNARPTVFLDRDGVLVEEKNYLADPSQVQLIPGVFQALKMLQDRFYLVVITNQSGIGRGLFTEETLAAIHSELVDQLAEQGTSVDAFYYCPHHPEAVVSTYRVACQCRKPNPGMLNKAANHWELDLGHSFMVGDRPSDMEASWAAGVPGIQVGNSFETSPTCVRTCKGLLEASEIILTYAETLEYLDKSSSGS
jgi:D-glycero-D-manno-heptose 1,7-bisphosphate phosphatase